MGYSEIFLFRRLLSAQNKFQKFMLTELLNMHCYKESADRKLQAF